MLQRKSIRCPAKAEFLRDDKKGPQQRGLGDGLHNAVSN